MAGKTHYQAEGFHTVTPYLRMKRAAQAIEFYRKAFGATEIMRLDMPDGRLGHAEIKLGDSFVMLSDEFPEIQIVGPETLGNASSSLMMYVPDVDKFLDQAVKSGATLTMPAADQFWGDRMGKLKDPFGHEWTIATHTEDVSPEEMTRRMQDECGGQK
jgi:PhnB protein